MKKISYNEYCNMKNKIIDSIKMLEFKTNRGNINSIEYNKLILKINKIAEEIEQVEEENPEYII